MMMIDVLNGFMASLTQQSSKLQGFKMVALISIYPCPTNPATVGVAEVKDY